MYESISLGYRNVSYPHKYYCDKGCSLRLSKNRRYEQPCNVVGIGKLQVQSERLKVNAGIKSLER